MFFSRMVKSLPCKLIFPISTMSTSNACRDIWHPMADTMQITTQQSENGLTRTTGESPLRTTPMMIITRENVYEKYEPYSIRYY